MSFSLDSDVVRKLASYLLLESLPGAIGTEAEACFVLPTLRYQLRLNKPAKASAALGSDAAVRQVLEFLSHAKEIAHISQEAANIVLGLDLDGLDAGERTLLAWLITDSEHSMLTGDKRAVRALGTLPRTSAIWGLRHRIKCLEWAISALVVRLGFAPVSTALRQRPDVDTALRMVFGTASVSNEASVSAGLNSYLNDLALTSHGFYLHP